MQLGGHINESNGADSEWDDVSAVLCKSQHISPHQRSQDDDSPALSRSLTNPSQNCWTSIYHQMPSNSRLWKGCRHPDIRWPIWTPDKSYSSRIHTGTSSVHTDMHSTGNETEMAENEARNFRTCQTEAQTQNLPVTHAVLSGSPPSIMQSICTMLLDNDDDAEDSRSSVSMSAKCSTLKQLT